MAKIIEVKTPEELGRLLGEIQAKVDETGEGLKSVAEKAKEEPEFVAALRTQQDELKTTNAQLIEKLKSLELAFKVKGSWKEQNTPEAKAYGMGKFVNTMLQARAGSKKATIDLLNMGAIPVRESTNPDEVTKIDVSGRFLKTNPDVSSAPLASDDNDTYYVSYLVPVEYSAEVGRVAADASAMMNRVTHVPMRGITKYVPNTVDALTFTMVASQRTAKTEDHLTFGRVTLTANTYANWIAITEEADEDSLVGLGSFILKLEGEAWGTKFDTLALSDSTYGALADTSVNELAMDTGDAAFSSIDITYLDGLISELTSQNKRIGAMFIMHPTVFDYIRGEKDAMGRYIFQDAVNGAPATIRGYPFVLSDGAPSTSAASTSFVLFGNPKWILAGDRTGFEFRIFDQTLGTMEYDQIYLRARVRQAMIPWVPGALSKLTTAA